jgi:hypothetical protein
MSLSDDDHWSICRGTNFIRVPGEKELRDTPSLWQRLWTAHRDELLAEWVGRFPGTRPEAYWRFEPISRKRKSDETEVAFLDRLGLIDDKEQEAIVERLQSLAEYNRWRWPDKPGHNYIGLEPYQVLGDQFLYAQKHGLLSDEEIEILTRAPRVKLPSESCGKVEVTAWPTSDDVPMIPQLERTTDVEKSKPRPPQPSGNGFHAVRDYASDGRARRDDFEPRSGESAGF